MLEGCQGFPLPSREVVSLRVTESGPDDSSIRLDWVRLLLDDNSYLQCYGDGGTLFSGQSSELECGPVR